MERFDLAVKATIGFIGAIISYLIGGLGVAFTVLLGLMMLDYITGLMVGAVNKNLSSRVGAKGFVRKLYVIILIGAVYMIERVVLDQPGYIGDGVAVAYCVMEFVSITENGGRLGVPMPRQIKNLISSLKHEQSDEK